MNTPVAELEHLLGEATRLLPRYRELTAGIPHEPKGIRRSELFFFFAAVAGLKPARIVESGRARAQSTLVLAKVFPESAIVSLESDPGSPDVAIAAERLRECPNVECRFGDSLVLLPGLVEAGDLVLIDGPKDFRALKLALGLLREGKPSSVFVHDLWLGSPARAFVDRALRSALLSDDPRWVERYAALDSRVAPPPAAHGMRLAYGATLGWFQPGRENYGARLLQCRAAQGTARLRETARKLGRRPALVRPKDFAPVR